jgi:N-acetylmuramoyl-L-alanine amidase
LTKLLFSFLLFCNFLFASTQTDLNSLLAYKKNYFSALLNGNKKQEYDALKQIIYYSKKLNKPTSKYYKELAILEKNLKISTIQNIEKRTPKKITKTNQTSKNLTTKYSTKIQDSVKSITIDQNKIIFHFRKNFYKRYLKYFEEKRGGFYRDSFDILGTFTDVNKLKLEMPQVKSVKRILIYKNRNGKIRLSLMGKKNLKIVYIISKKSLTIKVLESISSNQAQANNTNNTSYENNDQKIIVIDPGHGGKDSGAVGPNKRYEKVAVLKISQQLSKVLKQRGYKVFTTRNNNKFKKLKYRTQYANKQKADLFISIHANAVPKNKARRVYGIETYYLSPAKSERAKEVAALENQVEVNSMEYGTKNIFLMTLNRAKINASQKLALDVQNNIMYNLKKKYNKIKDNGVRKGPFWILVGAQMPAILVEVGFITHPLESKRLYSLAYQRDLAVGIANGIDSYFKKND